MQACSTLSVEEYLAHEQEGDVRHEYVDGYLYALAGGSSRHNRMRAIAMFIFGNLRRASRAASIRRG
jgi:Uma2 family endonuclease